jgi:hypothetical protein
MNKAFDGYSVEIHASVAQGLSAQILFDLKTQFVGRIDFYVGVIPPVSYLWHPNGTSDPNQIYIVLAMQQDLLDPIIDLLQHEGSYALELWPLGPMSGASTNGYGGVLKSLRDTKVPAAPLNPWLPPFGVAAAVVQGVRS